MGRIAVACYRPKPGKLDLLEALMRRHLAALRNAGLATSRPSLVMTSETGIVVEVFEWSSREAMERATLNSDIVALARDYQDVCELVPLKDLPESEELVAEFESAE